MQLQPPADRLIRRHEMQAVTGLHIVTIYRRMAEGAFPAPVRLGPRAVAWRESDIVKWQQTLGVGTGTADARVVAVQQASRDRRRAEKRAAAASQPDLDVSPERYAGLEMTAE